jgi:flavin-dependent dehydrogenase
VFEKIDVLDEVRAAAPPMKTLWNYIDGHVLSDPIEADEQHLRFFLCERRITLDWILYQRVKREPGVEVRLQAKVDKLIWQEGRVSGVRWSEPGGTYEATAKAVIGADGFYSTLAKALNPAYETYVPVQRCMYYTYYRGLDSLGEPTAEHHFIGDSLAYIFPTDADLTLVALSLPIRDFPSFKKDPGTRLQVHLESLPLLAPRLCKAERTDEIYGAGNIPCYQRIPYGPGWALVGDAQQILDPWSGMGIDHATTHADLLADWLHAWLREETSWEAAMHEYHTRARAWSEKTYRRTSMFAADLRPMTRAALIRRGLV